MSSKQSDIATLRLFNEKVVRLETTGLMRRFAETSPEVSAQFGPVRITATGPSTFDMVGRMASHFPDLDQDQVDAFVLTYRLFTQNNDRLSIANLARVYSAGWVPTEATDRFKEARAAINAYLDGFTSLSTSQGPIGIRVLLDVVIYGSLAHLKPEKVATLQSWRDGGIEGFVWAEFIVAAKRMCYYLGYLRDLNSAVLHNCGD